MAFQSQDTIEQARQKANAAREQLPEWISKSRDNHQFAEFLRDLGIYDKTEQYIVWIIKNFAELAHKFRIRLGEFVSYVVKYASSNKIVHLQVETTAQALVKKVLQKLVQEKYALYNTHSKMMILFDPNSPQYFYFNFEVMLEKYYTGLEEHIERAFPADQSLISANRVAKIDVWHNIEWKHFNENNMTKFSEADRLKIFRFIFPDRSQLVVHPGYVNQMVNLARNKVLYIVKLLQSKDAAYMNDLISFMNKKMPDLNLDINRLEQMIEDSVQSNIRFWMVFMANLERYLQPKSKLASFYQAACLMHAWALGMEQKLKDQEALRENIKKLWDKIQQTPILYTRDDIVDLARSLGLDKDYKETFSGLLDQAITDFCKKPEGKDPVYFQKLMLNNKEYFVVSNHLSDIFMAQLEIAKDRLKKHYLETWRAKFKNRTYQSDPLITSASEYLKDLYHKLGEEYSELYGMAHDQKNLVIHAIENYSNRSSLADWKRKHFKKGIDPAFSSMDSLLDLKHGDLINEAEAYSPLLKLFPFLRKLIFMVKVGDPTKPQEAKKKKKNLVKEAMTNVINQQKKPPRLKKRSKKVKMSPEKEKKTGALESVDDRKKAIREKLQSIQESLFGNKNIIDELQFLEKQWNRTIEQNLQKKEQIKKENKKYVVSIIQSHIKNMKLNLENVEKISRNIREDKQFNNITDKESLEKYIQGYVILTLQKKHA